MGEKTGLVRKEELLPEKRREITAVVPLVDIYENDDEILLYVDMPGVDKKDITVEINNGQLTLSGLRNLETKGSVQWEEFGDVEFQRTFSVPQTIDMEKVNAKLEDGVLHLHLLKSEAAKPRQIEIKVA
ncbi:MAG: Hsp20/alpha crystallin family protein [Desulfobacterium sp.]|jgi:HSP20 family molecular chaperone IbpA|nr:Hsp20/alpha crystallin family protein [Desulfobacterium sp.]